MYVKQQTEIRVNSVDKILDEVKKTGERLDAAYDLLGTISGTVVNLNVDIYDTTKGVKFDVTLSGIKEICTSLRCVIGDLEGVLGTFEKTPLLLAKTRENDDRP